MDERHIDQELVERLRLELMTRRLMVMLVGLIGVWVGIAVILTGAPNFVEQWFSPWSRYAVGGIPFLAGGAIVIGGFIGEGSSRAWYAEIVGLSGMALWYATMGGLYVALVTLQGFDLVGPGEPLQPEVTGRGYVPFLYLGLVLMSVAPLVAMIKLTLRRRRRAASRDVPAEQA